MNDSVERLRTGQWRRSLWAVCLSLAVSASLLSGPPGVGQAGAASLTVDDGSLSRTEAPACQVFPADNAWNQRIDGLPAHASSSTWVRAIGETERLRALFSASDGIPYAVVSGSTASASVLIQQTGESDPGPYRLPDEAPIESDHQRVVVLDRDRCLLAELRGAERVGPAAWTATAGALFDLRSNDLRPDGWASADEAGLPIYPGLVRLDEVERGEITHALRFSAPQIATSHLWPARRNGSGGSPDDLPPAGTRFRLKSTVNPDAFSPRARVILVALQRYGMLLAETGPAWGLSGAPHAGWDEGSLAELEEVFGASFEAVDVSSLVIDGGSGQSIPPPTPAPAGTPAPTKTPSPTATTPATTTPEPSPTITLTPTLEPTETAKPTGTPKPTKTPAPTETPAPTATSTTTPLPTATVTNIPTYTATPTATVRPSCVPRPSLIVLSEAVDRGRLKVTIESTNSSGVPNNALHELEITGLTNATVEVGGAVIRSPGPVVVMGDGVEEIHIFVERVAAGQAFTATLTVTDACGDWPTWVGGGASTP